MKNSSWAEVKEKQNEREYFEKELKIFAEKLEKIRSNRIALEVVEREINLKLTGERKPSKTVASFSISPSHELVISNFEPKKSSLITDTILKLGYDKAEKKSSKEKLYFTLAIMTKEKRDRYIQEVEKITEEGKIALRRVRENFRNLAKKDKDFSKDQKRNYENRIDKIKKDYENKLIEAEKKKIKELSS